MKSVIYEFDPVIYPFKLLITKKFDKDEMRAKYRAVHADGKIVPITDELDTDGTTTARLLNLVDNDDKLYYVLILFLPKAIGCGICTHEAVHCANAYLQYIGNSPAKAFDDEPYAYFAGWVSNCMWSVLVNEPEKMKGVKVE
jgi:hypothetical protein